MAVTERSRNRLHNHVEEIMGDEDAATLMELLPPVGWGDVATKQDLLAVEQSLRHEIHQETSALRVEMHQSLAELHRSIGETHKTMGETHKTMADLHKSIGDVHKSIGDVHKSLTWHTLSVIGATGAMVGLALGLAHWV